MKLWMENEKLYKRQCCWKVTELKDLAVKFRGQNGWCHQTHRVLALPAHGYQQNWPTAQLKMFLCILMDFTEVNVLWAASWPSTVCSELARLSHLTSQSHCLRGLLPQVTSEQLLWDLQLLQHSSWGWKLQESTCWWLDMSPRATQLLCVTLICAFPGVTGTGGCPAGNPCSNGRQKLVSLAPARGRNLDMKYPDSVMKAIPWARHWEFCTPVWSGRMSGRIFVRRPQLGEGFECGPWGGGEGWKQKLELVFPLLLVGASLEGDQDLPVAGGTPPHLWLEYSKETLTYHFLLFPEVFGVQLREIVWCDCYHQTTQSAWVVHCILRTSSHFNAMTLVQICQDYHLPGFIILGEEHLVWCQGTNIHSWSISEVYIWS